MVTRSGPSRRRILQFAGVTIGSAALGHASLAATENTASNPPSVEWTTEVDGVDIVQGTDGGFGLFETSPTVKKLGPNGELQWNQTFTTEELGEYLFQSICPAPDGGYVVVGKPEGSADAILIKLASNGTTVWRHEIDEWPVAYPVGVVQRPDEGYAVACGNPFYEHRRAGVVLLSEAGTIETDEEYEPATERYESYPKEDNEDNRRQDFKTIEATTDGYALLGGVHYDNYNQGPWQLSIDTSLDKKWEHTPEASGSNIIGVSDDVVITLGYYEGIGFEKYTDTGEIAGTYNYYEPEATSGDVAQRTTGEIVLGGERADETQLLLGVAPDGEKRWEWDPSIGPNTDVNSIISIDDGGLAVTGTETDGEQTTPFVAELTFDDPSEPETEPPTETATDSSEESDSGTDGDGSTGDPPESDTEAGSEDGSATETETPTEMEGTLTETTTARETEVGSASPTDTENGRSETSPAGPGFGPLAALGGLGLGAWRLLRRSDDS